MPKARPNFVTSVTPIWWACCSRELGSWILNKEAFELLLSFSSFLVCLVRPALILLNVDCVVERLVHVKRYYFSTSLIQYLALSLHNYSLLCLRPNLKYTFMAYQTVSPQHSRSNNQIALEVDKNSFLAFTLRNLEFSQRERRQSFVETF